MRAAVVDRYGPPEAAVVREVPTPKPGPRELLVRIRASTVNSGDARLRAANVPKGMGLMVRLAMGWSGPRAKILGFDFAGEVVEVGDGVSQFRPRDLVVGSGGFKFGCHAQYRVLKEDAVLVPKPAGLSNDEAVAVLFGGCTSLDFFVRGKLKSGERLLINGASGAVGVMAVQLAKRLGAHVTAVCSTANAELVASLGADRVIDYTQQDFAALPDRYDAIMDTVGNAPYARVKHLLAPGGRLLMVVGDLFQTIGASFNKQIIGGTSDVTREQYADLLRLADEGHLKPVIDSTFELADIAEAYRRVDGGHKRGSIVLRVA